MAINIEPTNPSTFTGLGSLTAPAVVLFPAVGNAAPIQHPAINDSVLALTATDIIHEPVSKIYGARPVLALIYGTPSTGIQVTTAPSANAIAERYTFMPPTVLP